MGCARIRPLATRECGAAVFFSSLLALPGQKRKFSRKIRRLWPESGIEQNLVSYWNCEEVRSFLPK